MGRIDLVSGSVSDVSNASSWDYVVDGRNNAVARSFQEVTMRVNNKPVLFRALALPSVKTGDQVKAAGVEKNGTLEALALKNVSTGATYHQPFQKLQLLSGALVIMGVPFLIFPPLGIFFIWQGVKGLRQASSLTQSVSLVNGGG